MKRLVLVSLTVATVLFTSGCGSLHPSGHSTAKSPWLDFASAKAAFDRIDPGRTTTEDLRTLGFDPYTNPNVRILNYLDIQNRFLPNQSVRMEDLPSDYVAAMRAQNLVPLLPNLRAVLPPTQPRPACCLAAR